MADESMADESMADESELENTADTVVYDVSDWESEQVDALEWTLGREGITSVLRDGELTVRAEDESRVDLLIDHLFDEVDDVELDAAEDEGESDINAMEALGNLFVAVDRMVRSVDDDVVRAEFEEAAGAIDGLSLPFGFEPQVWDRIQTMTGWLVDELDGADAGVIEEHAESLRNLVRQYV
jgi:hypothetical protein